VPDNNRGVYDNQLLCSSVSARKPNVSEIRADHIVVITCLRRAVNCGGAQVFELPLPPAPVVEPQLAVTPRLRILNSQHFLPNRRRHDPQDFPPLHPQLTHDLDLQHLEVVVERGVSLKQLKKVLGNF